MTIAKKQDTNGIALGCFLYGSLWCIVWFACQVKPEWEMISAPCQKAVEASYVKFHRAQFALMQHDTKWIALQVFFMIFYWTFKHHFRGKGIFLKELYLKNLSPKSLSELPLLSFKQIFGTVSPHCGLLFTKILTWADTRFTTTEFFATQSCSHSVKILGSFWNNFENLWTFRHKKLEKTLTWQARSWWHNSIQAVCYILFFFCHREIWVTREHLRSADSTCPPVQWLQMTSMYSPTLVPPLPRPAILQTCTRGEWMYPCTRRNWSCRSCNSRMSQKGNILNPLIKRVGQGAGPKESNSAESQSKNLQVRLVLSS